MVAGVGLVLGLLVLLSLGVSVSFLWAFILF